MLNRKNTNIVQSNLRKISVGIQTNRSNLSSGLLQQNFSNTISKNTTTETVAKKNSNENTTSIGKDTSLADLSKDDDSQSLEVSGASQKKITFSVIQKTNFSDEIEEKTKSNEDLLKALLEVNEILRDNENKAFPRFREPCRKIRNAIERGADVNFQLDAEYGKIFPLQVAILANRVEDCDFFVRKGARLDLVDEEGSNIVHLASRFKGNIFMLFYMTCLADSQEETRYLFSQKNTLKNPSDAMDFLYANKIDSDVSRQKLRLFIVLTFLSLDETDKLTSSAYPTHRASIYDDRLDPLLTEIASSYFDSFAVKILMNKNYHISREIFQALRLIEIDHVVNQSFASQFSSDEKKIITDFISHRFDKIKNLVRNSELTKNKASLNEALFSCYDYLSRTNETQRYFSLVNNLSKILLELGANANYTLINAGKDRNLPLLFLCSNSFDHDFLIANLIDNNANLKLRFKNQDILTFNCRRKNINSVKVLLEKEPQIFGLLENSGVTSLLAALQNLDYELAKILIDHSEKQALPQNKINFDYPITNNFVLTDLIIAVINKNQAAPDFFQFASLQKRINEIALNKEHERQNIVKETIRNLSKNKSAENISRLIYQASLEELLTLRIDQKKSALEVIFEFGSFEDVEVTLTKISATEINQELAEKILDSSFRNKNQQVLKNVLKQSFCNFNILVRQLKVFATKGDQQFFTKIILDPNFLEKSYSLTQSDFKEKIAEIRSENKSSIREKIKKLLNDFEKKFEESIKKETSSNFENSQEKKLSKNALKKLKAEERAERERLEAEEKRQKQQIKVTKINHQKLLSEFNENPAVQKKLMADFLAGDREISSISDLPKFTQRVVSSFLDEEFKVFLKGSCIQQNSRGLKFSNPNDLDLEVIKSGISEMSQREILSLICDKFDIDINSFPTHFDSEMTCKNDQGDEIKIFSNPKTRSFTVNFSSKSRMIDLSIYDANLPPTPHLTWNTSLDAARVEILPNLEAQRTYVENFLEYKKGFRASNFASEETFIINPNSHSLILRLAFFIESGLVELDEAKNAITASGLRVMESLKKELKFNESHGEIYSTHQCQNKINDFCSKHNFDSERQNNFLTAIKNLADSELQNQESEKFRKVLNNLLRPTQLKAAAIAATDVEISNQSQNFPALRNVRPQEFKKLATTDKTLDQFAKK